MRPNPVAPWVLRIGQLRVYYEVVDDSEPVVGVLAIGRKQRDTLIIGSEVIEL